MSLIIEKGKRGVIVGRTGSGKTQMLIMQMKNFALSPVYILNTKDDIGLNLFIKAQKNNAVTIHSVKELTEYVHSRTAPDYINIVPRVHELLDRELLDDYLQIIYNAKKPCLVCIDEAGQLAYGKEMAGPGLMNLLARGRSRGISLLCCTQRPAWISKSVFTESELFFIYRLLSTDDYKKLVDLGLPYPIYSQKEKGKKVLNTIDTYCFWYYNIEQEDGIFYSPIEIQFDPGTTAGEHSSRKWFGKNND